MFWLKGLDLEFGLNFKLLLNLSLTHLRAQIACYELKGDLSPVMLKKNISLAF